METLRLRRIQEPSRVERLLETFVSRRDLLPGDAYQIRDAKALPESLRSVIARAVKQGQVWSCWADSSRHWLFTSDMSLPLSRERGAPVLQVNRYAEDGALEESGAFMTDSQGKWIRCSD